MDPLSGLVLAGGASRRMGTDKALLEVAGETLAARAVRSLRTVCLEVIVASGDGSRLPVGDRQVADALADAGPLAGLVAGLDAAAHDLVAVTAVDLPFANPALLALLARLHQGEPAVVPRVDGRLQPLHAVYARSAADRLRALLAAGERSVTAAVRALDPRVAETDEWAPADPTGRFAWNVNRPQDLEGLEA
ncbi:MAG TPA: molybdenum cofactor guanylyltransferase [Egibacteraceae bacterium]|nr:molybdenum cofactor guanylyltransferase [Egibacteraceae bacterium]